MALSSYSCSSVTGLSKSPLFHFQYSSISDAIKHFALTQSDRETVERLMIRWCLKFHWHQLGHITLATDKTPIRKPHSPTLKNRTLVAVPNSMVNGNKPLDIGFDYSFVNLQADALKSWSLPLMINHIPLDQTPNQVAGYQVCSLMGDENLPFAHHPIVVNTLDRGYGAMYLQLVKKIGNLVSIINLRHSSKVYVPAYSGGKKVFGQCYHLIGSSCVKIFNKHPKTGQPYSVSQKSICERPADDSISYKTNLKNGRAVIVNLRRYNNLWWRTKQGINMVDKPFDILCVKVLDSITLKQVFPRPLFVAAVGEKRAELSMRDIYEDYGSRYDIEPQFRFAKQKLFLQAFQTCIAQHLHNWMNIVMMALWMLFTARNITTNQPEKWQQYCERQKDALFPTQNHTLSMSQVRKSIQKLLLTFDKIPFLPLKSKPGPGRKYGETQHKREKYPYVKKINAKGRNP